MRVPYDVFQSDWGAILPAKRIREQREHGFGEDECSAVPVLLESELSMAGAFSSCLYSFARDSLEKGACSWMGEAAETDPATADVILIYQF